MPNEMVRFPSELVEEAAKLAHEDGKSTSTWIRDLVAAEVFIRKHRLHDDSDPAGAAAPGGITYDVPFRSQA